jgi:alkanesulfonate monooxygenase SsuD/methylene tetrahydromethanopterin reductase-like flavin-dependent oxidoreductase (luciferase family)
MSSASRWVTHPWVAQGAGVPRFGIELFPLPRDWSVVAAMAQLVEELEFDSLWVADHATTGSDCWTTLAALAMVTTKIRLGSLTSCVFYRHPVVLARMAADVD